MNPLDERPAAEVMTTGLLRAGELMLRGGYHHLRAGLRLSRLPPD